MEKTLIFMRHAQPNSHGGLSEDGRSQAQALRVLLDQRDLTPDITLTSTFGRTVQTGKIISADIILRKQILASTLCNKGRSFEDITAGIENLIRTFDNNANIALLVCHQPWLLRLTGSAPDYAGAFVLRTKKRRLVEFLF